MALTERLQVIIEAIGGNAGVAFTKLGKDAESAYKDVTKGAAQAESGTSRFGSVAQAAALAGGTALGVVLVKGIKSAVDEFVNLGEQTRKLEELTGASAQEASTFSAVLKTLGVDTDSVSKGLGIFAAHIQQTPGLLAKYGIEIKRNSQGNVDFLGTLENVRTKLQGTSDATQRDAIAKQLLGRSYQTLLPYLSLTNDQLALFKKIASESGQILSQDDVDKARQMKVAVAELDTQFEAFKIKAGRFGVDFANDFLLGIKVLSKINISDILHLDFSGARAEAAGEQAAAGALGEAKVAAQESADAKKQLESVEKNLVTSAKGLASAQKEVAQAHRSEADAVYGVTKAEEGLQKAHEGVQRAQESLNDAQDNLNQLLAKGAVDAQKVADAEKNLEASTRGVENAQQSLADAQDRLNTALAGASEDEKTDAQLALERATLGAASAQDALNKANAPHAGRSAAEQANAELALREALQQEKEAREKVDALKVKGTATDKDVVSAQRAVRDATQAVADAISNQDDAAAKLREAQAGDPAFDKQVADAKRAVRDASYSLRDSLDSERDAAKSVRDAHQAVTDAQDKERDASYNLRDANYQLSDALDAASTSGADLRQVWDDLISRYPELAGDLGNLKSLLDQPPAPGSWVDDQGVLNVVNPGAVSLNPPPGSRRPDGSIVGHASGGYFTSEHVARIAEGGTPEGVIRPNDPTQTAGILAALGYGGGGSGGGMNVTVHVHGSVLTDGELTEKVYRALTKAGGRYSALRK